MPALREVLAAFEIQVETKALEEGTTKLKAFTGIVKESIENLKGGFKFESLGIGDMFSELSTQSKDLRAVTAQYGIGLDDLQRLMFQTGKDAGELGGAFRLLEKNISQASGGGKGALEGLDEGMAGLPGGGKKAQEAFKALGISAEDLKNKTPVEIFTATGEAIAGLESPSDRVAASMAIFGRNGAALVPTFLANKDAMRELGEEYDAVGGFTEENIQQFKKLDRAKKSEELGWQKIKLLLAEQLLPVFIATRKAVAWFIQGFAKVTARSSSWKIAGVAIAAVLAVMNAGMLKFIANTLRAAAPWIALFLIVEDIVTFFRGGESVLGDFLNSIGEALGIGEIGKEAQKAFAELVDFIENSTITEFFQQAWEDIGRIWKFGFGETWAEFSAWDEKITAAFLDWATKLPQTARDAAAGIIKGLVDGLAGSLWGAFKKKLGINSPSTVFADLGENVNAGFAEGVTRGPAVGATATLVRAPTVGSTSYGPRTAMVEQNNSITINTGGERGGADGVRDALPQILNDDRRAALAALEAVAP
jgi:hypothetical protein